MKKIIQITDTHVCPRGQTILGIDPVARLETIIESVNRNHTDADYCVFTGDLTDRGDIESYERFYDLVSSLKIPYRLLLGNHDERENFRQVFSSYPVDQAGYVQEVVELGDFICLHLDTLDQSHAAEGLGLLCDQRMKWLGSQLDQFKDRNVILFMHHPLLSIGMPWFDPMLVRNGRSAVDLIREKGNVVHVAFGHVHVNTLGTWRGIAFSASRGTCHKIVTTDAADTQVDYVDHGPAYDILLLNAGSVCVHTIDPAGPTQIIGRETATPDGKGAFQAFENGAVERWL